MTITLRSVKGSALTHAEMDANFADLAGRPTITGRSLALGAGTLTPATGFAGLTDIFVLNGTAAAAFELTVADGTVVNQQIQFIVIGDVDVYTIDIADTTAVFSRAQNGDNFTAWWTGTGWTRREMSKTWRPVIFDEGSPVGVLRPQGIGQIYVDELTDEKYLATGLATASWSLFDSASDSFTTSDDANTAITIGAAPNTHRRLTSSSAITLTLSATAAVGTKQSVVKKGSGTITAQVTGSSTYKLPGDTAGRTASFVLSGYGFFECVANSGGSAAEWDFTGESDHAETLDSDVDFAGNLVYGNLGSVVTGVTGTLTTAAHLGRMVVTSGNITIPTTAGFNCLIKAGGAHTVSFHDGTSLKSTAAATTGQVCSVYVQSATVVVITPWATPQTLS